MCGAIAGEKFTMDTIINLHTCLKEVRPYGSHGYSNMWPTNIFHLELRQGEWMDGPKSHLSVTAPCKPGAIALRDVVSSLSSETISLELCKSKSWLEDCLDC